MKMFAFSHRDLALLLCSYMAAALFSDPVDLFIAGEPPEVNNYRIPALARTAKGTLVAVVEARTTPADCCYKWLAFRRSTDNGTTWSPVAEIWGKTALTPPFGAGNPALVFDNVTNTLILHGSVNDATHCSPTLYTFQIDDGGSDGQTWGNLKNLTEYLGQYDGATPGPGTGTQLGPNSPAPGRLIVPAHFGVYAYDVSWYSDDHGATWTLSKPALPNLDEVVTTALPSGKVMLNARTDHYNASCQCRATTTSSDGGATWDTPVSWDATLIEPVCQASLVTLGPLTASGGGTALYFSNPASTNDRANITVRRSNDEGASWQPGTWVVGPGETWGGYSCIASGAPMTRYDGETDHQYGGILWEWERPGGLPGTPESLVATPTISFALFPVELPPRPRIFIPASHPSVSWTGRYVVRPDGSVSFDMPGTTAVFNVNNASYFQAEFISSCAGGPRVESSIDGGPLDTDLPGAFWLYSQFAMPHGAMLADDMDITRPHTLTLRMASEARWANCTDPWGVTLSGIFTDGTAPPSPPPAAGPVRRIEWVGDSITAGFGTAPMSWGTRCPSTLQVQDVSRAAPFLVCAALNASCSMVAVSGDSVLTPPPAVTDPEKPPIPLVYPRALTYQPAVEWDMAAFVPDVIVLNLGTNDQQYSNFNTSFVPALTTFLLQLSTISGYYGSVGAVPPRTLLYCGPIMFNYCAGMQQAVTEARYIGADVAFLGPVNATLDGCDGHPGPVGQQEMAHTLQGLIAAAMGW